MDVTLFLAQDYNEVIRQASSGPGIGGGILAYLIYAVTLYVCANKLNEENPWFAFIPFVNFWYFTKVAGREWWWALVLLVPCLGIIAMVYLWWSIFERRGKSPAMSLLMAIPCLNIIASIYVASD
jgi:hypothetical protein